MPKITNEQRSNLNIATSYLSSRSGGDTDIYKFIIKKINEAMVLWEGKETQPKPVESSDVWWVDDPAPPAKEKIGCGLC